MRHAGERDERPVYVGTLCNAAGVRQLMRYAGEHPGFWVDGDAGPEWVPPRSVYVSAECSTQFVGPSGGFVTTGCCPDLALPSVLYAQLVRTAGECDIFGGGVIPVSYVGSGFDPAGGADGTDYWRWDSSPAGDQPFVRFECRVPRFSVTPPFWRIWVEFDYCDFYFPTDFAALDTAAICPDPFCAVFTGTLRFVQTELAISPKCCETGQTAEYIAAVYEPAAAGLCDPTGSGAGSGSGVLLSSSVNRTLMRFGGFLAARNVYLGTCCPPRTGAGSGGGGVPGDVQTACEIDPISGHLAGTPAVTSGTCAAWAGGSTAFTNSGGSTWTGYRVVLGHTVMIVLSCGGDGNWDLDMTDISHGLFDPNHTTLGGGGGFPLVFAVHNPPGCPGAIISLTFTEL